MSVLIDTSVWSLGLRRRKRDLNPVERKMYHDWEDLLIAGEAAIIGIIRQETLSGIINAREFAEVEGRLALVPDILVDQDIYVLAAKFYNRCRGAGISPGPIDMTICAAASSHDIPIFTSDPDFPRYARHLPIKLYVP